MINNSNSLNKIGDYLKGLLQKAGHKVKSGTAEGNQFLKIPDLGIILDIRWKSQLNDAVLLTLANTCKMSEQVVNVVATGNLSKGMFERCRDKGLSVIDMNGNGCIDIPGFWYERFISQEQKKRIPVSGTPFSKKASRLVRAFLAEPARKWTQSDLINATGFTQGYASKSLKVLFKDGYIGAADGSIQIRDPDRLLDDWASHYRFDRHRQIRYAFSYTTYEEGLERLGASLKDAGIKYGFTGWSGAHLRAAYAVPPSIMAFVTRIPEAPEKIGLYPVVHGENCILIEPQDEGVLQFSQDIKGLIVVSDPQIYVDLRRMPGRALDQAEVIRKKLLNWEGIDNE